MPKIYQKLLSLFLPAGLQAIADGLITPEQYRAIPWREHQNVIITLRDPNMRQAMANGVITLERYLHIPSDERRSMKYLFSREGRQAVADGLITLERYLQIPAHERWSMEYLFSLDGRQAMAEGVITLERYLQLSRYERLNIEYLFSRNGRQAMADGVITLEQYRAIPWNERDSMEYLFSRNGRQAMADGIITLERYLHIPWKERDSMECLFSYDGRQAMADGVITLERYLHIPYLERLSMKHLFSYEGLQAMADGLITLERYLRIPAHERWSMKYLFSYERGQVITGDLITLEQYRAIPREERHSMGCLFSRNGRQAMADGIITLEQYREIPWNERDSMKYIFSYDGRQAIAEGIITLERYLHIPYSERLSMKHLFSYDGRQAVADGLITLEHYRKIPLEERLSMECLFSRNGRQAIADGLITLEQYLHIPWNERLSMQTLFSPEGRQAVADGIITLKRYLQIPAHERWSMQTLFSSDGRQAVADGLITLEHYREIPPNERWSMTYLFSPDGRQAIAEDIITLERYLHIPWEERQDVMIALQDLDTRQRIINGQITIEHIIGIPHPAYGVAAPHINGAQSTHTPSVHQSTSESATRLADRYQLRIDGAGLEHTIEKAQAYISGLSDDAQKNKAAKRGFLRIVAPDYTFTDPSSRVSLRQLLALTFLAIQDDEKRTGRLDDAQMQFVDALYESQRGYNLSESGADQGGPDRYICSTGTFNKLIEKLHGLHPDCNILYITRETASLKLPIVVREEGMRYLATCANPNTAEALRAFTDLMEQVKRDGVEVIWDHIKDNIAQRMFDEFGSLYQDRTDPRFTALVEVGKGVEVDLNSFQEQVQNGNYFRSDDSDIQREAIITPEETFLIEASKEIELDELSTYQEIALQLNKLETKAKNLRDRDHILAANKAIHIVQSLRDLNQDYFTEKKFDAKTYKEQSFALINQERPELAKHRGYKQILGNLLILITTLGTGQLLNKVYTGHFLFFNRTDTAKHIDKLCHTIEKMEFNCPSQSLS